MVVCAAKVILKKSVSVTARFNARLNLPKMHAFVLALRLVPSCTHDAYPGEAEESLQRKRQRHQRILREERSGQQRNY